MRYYQSNGIHIVEVPANDFSIVMCDKHKKRAEAKNYCNAGFFATYNEGGTKFTLPVGHLVCDFDADNKYAKKYCEERGEFVGDKFKFDSGEWSYANEFYGKKVSTLMVSKGSASIVDAQNLPSGLDYAIAGIPIMRSGADVKFATYVRNQGWDGGPLYATWHIFIGLKKDGKTIYVMGMKTKTGNMILSAEAYKKFKALGMYDVIKLDGGGSFYMNVSGKAVASTLENRLINTIICFGQKEKSEQKQDKNPYPVPTVALRQGNLYKEFNKWLQWQLTYLGFECEIDGSFGPSTKKQVIAFQKSKGLEQDASVGPATRKALLEV